jgi:hypothetical protein
MNGTGRSDEQTEVNQRAIRKGKNAWGTGEEEGDGIVRTSWSSGGSFIYLYPCFFSASPRVWIGSSGEEGERERDREASRSLSRSEEGGRGFW